MTELCEDCKKNEAKLTFAEEPIFAITHGFGKRRICRECLIKRCVKKINKIQEQVIEQKELIAKEK